MPSLGPSEQLLKAVMAGAIDWKEFTKRYRDELFLDGPIDDRSETIKNHGQKSTLRLLKALGAKQNVTLMCHCAEDAKQCHRFLLPKEIAKAYQISRARISGGGISHAFDSPAMRCRIAATTR